ncbi:MAG: hypothetical protein JXB18_11685 [Sedimentisphaerales bacterium]|nr:hypothetical protein [Sedimentisphaerales bacterium]
MNSSKKMLVCLWLSLLSTSAMYAQEQSLPDSAEGPKSPGVQLIDQVMAFRQQARTQPEEAFTACTGKKAQKIFGPLGRTLCPNTDPSRGWAYFFETSVFSMSFITSSTALAVFYHPWSDVALITEWTRSKTGNSITDAELLMGDTLRNQGNPPYDIEPHWLRSPVPPYLAASLSSAQTIQDFRRIFSPQSSNFKKGWRSVMTNSKLLKSNYLGAGFMFEHNLAGLLKFQNDADFAAVRQQSNDILAKLQRGLADEVLAVAVETRPESQEAIKQYAAQLGQARAITCIRKRDDQKKEHLFVIYSIPGRPECLMSLWFKPEDAALQYTLKRIDLVDQNNTYVHFDAITNVLKNPQ